MFKVEKLFVDQKFELHHLTLAGLVNNNTGKPKILCLHGWLDNAASFTPLLPYLDEYDIIALDWPGHGKSDHKSIDAHYHFIDYAYDLLAFIEQKKWTDIHLVGHSMGGMIASAFTAAFPEKIKSLTLIDTIGFIALDSEKTTEQLRNGMLSRFKVAKKSKSKHLSIDSAIKARVAVSDLSAKYTKLIVERGLEKIEEAHQWSSDHRVKALSPYRLSIEQAKQLITDIKVPVQLLYGSDGMEMVQQGIKVFKGCFTDLVIHQLPGGHHVHMEQAEECSDYIKSFIQAI